MKKLLFRGLLVLFLLPVLLLGLGGAGYAVYAWLTLGQPDPATLAYLRGQQRTVPMDGTAAFPDFEAGFYANQLFLLGESHGSAAPQELDFALLRHLNQKTGLRNYVAEIDPSQAFFFNRYLATGHESDLQTVFRAWDGKEQWGNQDFYDKVRRIRQLNQTLPPAARIRFIGLDRFQDTGIALQHLRAILAQEPVAAGRSAVLDTLRGLSAGAPPTQQALAQLAHRLLPAFGPDSAAGGLSVAGRAQIAQVLRNASYLQGPRIRRDSVMLLNLQADYERLGLQQEKMYRLWGVYHVLQSAVSNSQPFAALVRSSALPLRGRVVSVAIFAAASETMIPAGAIPAAVRPPERSVNVGWLNSAGPVVLVPGIRDLLAAAPAGAPLTLFRLDAPQAPYRHSLRLVTTRAPLMNQTLAPTRTGAATTDYFQYAVLLRNSAAVRPLVIR
ncbi:hypothetical protein [Hymenobacter sp.]|uniref:hypothetical protein n=1 Tax=Hymenobacter sp. TaxID=1898978 RepID=UPI00286BBAC0|nr:hypothetical protein [Hymenobacter sp.]